ncbi:hypothetical protein BEWA_026520 [Theileria equi strain WA]|uniref:Uncharacterized protein n=1 Tax=Theileria equi strain WA TaxID=1537102 RepID=L0AX22_THEEQ|nr:hypothetical protein BEWA_026520 [Theileria equi strain WA]AFZ79803.1 hypothetical protein BEWA_026520 [Theileria equi strain WA]|eukprot:XP_004829469.1 hypothetical protein BEWA_026520 [Theileria equi strain WA]
MGEKEPIAVLYRFKRASDGKLVEGYRQFSDGNWSQVKKDDLTKLLEEAKLRNNGTQDNSILVLAKSKVDSTLFDVFGFVEGNVPVLKLTAKNGTKTTELNYDNKQIWSGKVRIGTSSTLVEAIIYFYKEIPALVNIKVVKGGKESTVYRYYDGSKWKDDKEEEHKKKLSELKNKPPKTPSIIAPASQSAGNSSNLPSSDQDTLDLEKPGSSSYRSFDVNIQGVPAKVYVSTSGNTVKKVTNGNEVV